MSSGFDYEVLFSWWNYHSQHKFWTSTCMVVHLYMKRSYKYTHANHTYTRKKLLSYDVELYFTCTFVSVNMHNGPYIVARSGFDVVFSVPFF